MATNQYKNNKRRIIRERTEKGSVNKMLNTFNDKIDDLEFEDFDESVDINEARDAHTWGITYRDKSNRTKQHMVGASDAYDAKMKARKELGINFSDIDDIELVEGTDSYDTIEERVEDYLYQIIGDRFEEWFMDITDNLSQTIYSKFKDYNPDWCNDEPSVDIDDFYDDIVTKIVGLLYDDLFAYYDE